MHNALTTRQLAEALGVSESSVKRWIDDGRIVAARTAGGHRRVGVEEAARYIRDAGMDLERPASLGLADLAVQADRKATDADAGELLLEHLSAGRVANASGLLLARFLAGASVARLVDGPLVHAMAKAGELWLSGPQGIFAEHRATESALQALSRLRALLRPAPDGPMSIGCAPSGDPYVLPSLAAAAVLEDEGCRAVNLGPETPLKTLALGMEALRPRLVWISVSTARKATALRREVLQLAERAREIGAVLVVGGAQVDRLALPRTKPIYGGRSMAELRAVARGLTLPAAALDGEGVSEVRQ